MFGVFLWWIKATILARQKGVGGEQIDDDLREMVSIGGRHKYKTESRKSYDSNVCVWL